MGFDLGCGYFARYQGVRLELVLRTLRLSHLYWQVLVFCVPAWYPQAEVIACA